MTIVLLFVDYLVQLELLQTLLWKAVVKFRSCETDMSSVVMIVLFTSFLVRYMLLGFEKIGNELGGLTWLGYDGEELTRVPW
jgi:hypothetical protein